LKAYLEGFDAPKKGILDAPLSLLTLSKSA